MSHRDWQEGKNTLLFAHPKGDSLKVFATDGRAKMPAGKPEDQRPMDAGQDRAENFEQGGQSIYLFLSSKKDFVAFLRIWMKQHKTI